MENRLKEMLATRGLSVSEFARMTGISQPTLHRIVNGVTNLDGISAVNFMSIAHGLGLSAEQIYFCDMNYDKEKSFIDRIWATTSPEGRKAMLANAYGIMQSYPQRDEGILPGLDNDIDTLKNL